MQIKFIVGNKNTGLYWKVNFAMLKESPHWLRNRLAKEYNFLQSYR